MVSVLESRHFKKWISIFFSIIILATIRVIHNIASATKIWKVSLHKLLSKLKIKYLNIVIKLTNITNLINMLTYIFCQNVYF